jgi:hypothetical protein
VDQRCGGKGQTVPRGWNPDLRLWAKSDRERGGTWQVTEEEARELNQKGFGIFWTPNEHTGRRLKANVTRLNYWFCEIDSGTKDQQATRLRDLAIRPTFVVESARSYHCYWAAKDASMDTWYPIQRGLVRAAKADPAAIDPLRLLRVPGYYHHKAEPFLVQEVWRIDSVHTAEAMLQAFPLPPPKQRGEVSISGDDFWRRVGSLDCGEAILALNGHWLFQGREFSLTEESNGNRNLVDRELGRTCGCFVRIDGSISGVADGARIAGWIKGHFPGWTWGDVARGLKEVFPEVEDGTEHT